MAKRRLRKQNAPLIDDVRFLRNPSTDKMLCSLLDIRDSYKECSFNRGISLTAYRMVLKTLYPWPRFEDRLMAAAIFRVNLLLQQQKTPFKTGVPVWTASSITAIIQSDSEPVEL